MLGKNSTVIRSQKASYNDAQTTILMLALLIKEIRLHFDLLRPTEAASASSSKQASCLKHQGEVGSQDCYYKKWRVRCGKWCWPGANRALLNLCPVSRGKKQTKKSNRTEVALLELEKTRKKRGIIDWSS